MITEKGTIVTASNIDEKAVKELNKQILVLGILYTVIGAIAFAIGCIVFISEIFLSDSETTSYVYYLPFFLGIILLTAGIILIISYNAALNTTKKYNKVDELEFFSDYFLAREYTNGELTGVQKYYYGWILKRKETANYIFLFNTRATAFGIEKSKLPLNELNAVRGLIMKTTTAASQPAPTYVAGNTVYTQEQTVPQDPFAEFAQSVSPAPAPAEPARPADLPPEPEKSESEDK